MIKLVGKHTTGTDMYRWSGEDAVAMNSAIKYCGLNYFSITINQEEGDIVHTFVKDMDELDKLVDAYYA